MSFVLLRVRLGQFLRKLGDSERRGWDWVISANVPLEEKQLKIGQMEDSLKEITQYCDAEIPIQATILRMSRIVISKLKWLAHHPRRGTQAREDQFKYGIDLVEVEVTARLSINTRRFMWHAQSKFSQTYRNLDPSKLTLIQIPSSSTPSSSSSANYANDPTKPSPIVPGPSSN